ncbi:unnamed protein product [Cuscuta epithymum]|uniref:SWIM-type domain-containing protein n=1 Tax=Cuscuta epithymum TaxID=186058 RepID=A0AAV0GCR5_9ASTE|nr:unnamed protein product [Cuscuta epithymum]
MAERVAHPGPQDRSVLFMLPDEHRADRVWHESSFRDVKLKCQHYSREAYVEEGPRHPRVVQLLRVSGFHGVERIGQLQLDWSLVTALVERWRPEVHAFHLPFGEVGLTLQDVQVLLGLPIDGIPLTVNLSRRVCDCGCWRMNGMPCVHAHSVCHFLNCSVDYLIPEVYKLSSYINAHSSDIMPFPNMNEWPQNEFILLPPKYSSRTSRAGRRQETRFPNEMDMRPRRRGQHD